MSCQMSMTTRSWNNRRDESMLKNDKETHSLRNTLHLDTHEDHIVAQQTSKD